MIKLKNYNLYGEFGKAVSSLSERKDLNKVAKLALIKIYRHLEQAIVDIEKVRPVIEKDDEGNNIPLKPGELKQFQDVMDQEISFNTDKVCINDLIELLSTKELLALEPIIKE